MWTKYGSIPQAETDGTDGWTEAPEMPAPVDGKEIVWLNWQWVVRDPKPVDNEGYRWKWNHDAYQWIEYALPGVVSEPTLASEDIVSLVSTDIQALTTAQIAAL